MCMLMQMYKDMVRILTDACAAVVGNQTALDALVDWHADVLVGDQSTPCTWILSDLLK